MDMKDKSNAETAYEDGYRACGDGIAEAGNPHKGTMADLWNVGWWSARADQDDRDDQDAEREAHLGFIDDDDFDGGFDPDEREAEESVEVGRVMDGAWLPSEIMDDDRRAF